MLKLFYSMEKICIKNMGEKHSFEKKIKPQSSMFFFKPSLVLLIFCSTTHYLLRKRNCVLFLYL